LERGPNSFGQALRASRLRARLTQRELADRAGVSLRTIRSIELGQVERPRRDSVERLARVLGLPVPPDGDAAPEGVRIGLLGSLAVTADGEPVGLGASKQRTLFTLLALQPNQVVSREEIIDTLWGDRPPATCLNLVHTYVSGLRKAFAPASPISSVPGGYRLTADAAELDVVRFDELVAEAQRLASVEPPRAAELYAQALDQWRGPGFAELPSTLSGHPVVAALCARRVAAALSYADVELPRGRAEQVVGRLRPVAHQEPLHEALHARLMLALAGCGQQAAALGLFGELRQRLAGELGVEPGPEIRAAHGSIVRDELPAPALRAGYTQPAPAELPADVAGFVGREEHLGLLDDLLPETGISAIVGTPGVGKTALAVHWAHRVRAKFPDGQLYVNLHGYASGSPVRPVEALRRFLRALGVPGDRIPVDIDEAAALYRTKLADRRALIVLDNAATVTQVRPLLPGSPGSLVLITSRDRLTGLAATEGARRLDLEVLAPADARALLVRMLGEERALAEPDALDALTLTCAYLPLALRVAGANLDSGPYITIAEYLDDLRERGRLTELTVDGDPLGAVRTAFDLSYERLDAPTRRIFRLLGLVPGADFTPHAAAALAESSLVDARRSLAALAAASLVTEHVAGRFHFHDLLREYAAERAGLDGDAASARAAASRLFEFYLRTAAAADRLLYPYVERMTGQGESVGDSSAAITSEAEAVGWLDAERANLFAAVVQAKARGLGHYAWPLVDAVRGYLWTRGHSSAGLTAATIGLKAAQEEQNRSAEGAMYALLGLIHYSLSDYRQSAACHLHALAISRETGNRAAEAGSLHNLGRVHAQTGPHTEEAGYYEQALKISREEGYRHGEASALNYVGVAALSLGELDKAAEHGVRALTLSRQLGDRDLEARSLHNLGLVHWARGELDQSISLHRECLELARRIQSRHGVAPSLISLAETHNDAGRHLEAEDYARAGVAEGRELGERRHEVGGLDILATVSQVRGEHTTAVRGYLAALEMAREIGFLYGETNVLIGLSVARRSLGAYSDAVDDLRRAFAVIAPSGPHILEARIWTEFTHACLDAGDRGQAREAGDRAVEIAAERGQRLVRAQALHARARVRAAMGDDEGARADGRTALAGFTRAGVPAAAGLRQLLGALGPAGL
jgi:DNA-binding SARP family transcriptional activator/tetratricopeptide (TPR) repeat protein/DNA-binding XRE family transcriptional regulator